MKKLLSILALLLTLTACGNDGQTEDNRVPDNGKDPVVDVTARYLELWGEPRYVDNVYGEGGAWPEKFATDEVAMHYSSSRDLNIYLRNSRRGDPVEVRVGSHIYPVDWTTATPINDYDYVRIIMTDIMPGTYDVALHWPDAELPFKKKIRILPLKAETEEIDYGLKNLTRWCFTLSDKMYWYVRNTMLLTSYDLNTKTLKEHNEVPKNISVATVIADKGYAITENTPDYGEEPESVVNNLYEYTPTTDTWKLLSPLPVKGTIYQMKTFSAAGNVYVFGGYYKSPFSDEPFLQTWKFDVGKGEWFRMADCPDVNIMQAGDGAENGYFLTTDGYVWMYDTAHDKWTNETFLKPVANSTTQYQCLLEHGGKLFCIGDGENSSIYRYDFGKKEWELLGLYDFPNKVAPYYIAGTFHDGKLILGPRWKYKYGTIDKAHIISFDMSLTQP